MNHNVLLGNRSHERNALVKHRRYKSAECSQCSPGRRPFTTRPKATTNGEQLAISPTNGK